MTYLYLFNSSRKLALVVLLTIFSVVGCTKKEESSQMKIAMPDWKALAQASQATSSTASTVNVVSRVMINISGPDIPTQVRIWSLNDLGYKTGDPIPTPPTTFTFDVRRGSDRLFQVLAIVQQFNTTAGGESDGDGPMAFYYGDVTKGLARDVEDIPIQLASQGVVGADMGNITGRYLDTSGVGPTARLNMFYAPPGRPEMIVDTGTMFSGFFDVGLPAVAQFSYRLAGGQTLFDRYTINSLDGALGPQLMRLEVPDGFNERSGTRTPRSGSTRVIGFVGPGSASKRMCYSAVTEPLQNLFASATVGNTQKVNWNPTSNAIAEARVVGGGTVMTDPACVAASELGGDHFKLITQALAYGDSPVAIRGPFQEVSPSTNTFLSGSHAGSNLTLTWKYLKPTLGDSVDGVGVFTKVLAAGEVANKRWQDSAPCSMLVSNHGFTEVTRVAAGPSASPLETYVVPNVTATDYAAGKHVTLLCPYSNTKGYYDFALMPNGNNGGPQVMPVATKLVTRRIASPVESTSAARVEVGENSCTPIIVRMTDASGSDGMRTGATGPIQVQASIVGNPSDASLHSGPDCGPGGATTKTYSTYGNQTTVWLKTQNTLMSFDLQLTDVTVGGTALTATTFFGGRYPPSVPTHLRILAPTTVTAHQCFQVTLVQGTDLAGNFIPLGSTGTISLTTLLGNYSPDLGIYTDSDCTAATSSVSMTSYQTTGGVWVKSTAPGSIAFAPDSGLTMSPPTIAVQLPGAPAMLRVEVPSMFGAETCQAVKIKSYDTNGNPSPTSAMGVVTFTYDGNVARPANSGAYSDAMCSVPIGSETVGMGDTQSDPFYMRFATPGPVAVSGTTTNGQTVPVSNVGVGPVALAAIIARIPEVTWTFGGGYVGYGPQQSDTMAGAFTVILEARSPLGNLVTTFNEPNTLTSGINLTSQLQPLTCSAAASWTGGVATMTGCYLAGGVLPGYGFKFRTGGMGTPYPFHQSSDQFLMAAAAENGFGSTYFLSQPSSYGTGVCQPAMVQLRAAALALPVTANYPVMLSKGSFMASFHNDPACGTAEVFSTTIPPGRSQSIVYMLMNGNVPNPTAGGAMVPLNDPYTFSAPSYVSSASAGAAATYRLTAIKSTMEAACEPVMAVLVDAQGTAVTTGANRTLTLLQNNMGATFHTMPNCGDLATTTVTLPANESAVVFYYRPMTITGSGQIIVNEGGLTGLMSPITVNDNGM